MWAAVTSAFTTFLCLCKFFIQRLQRMGILRRYKIPGPDPSFWSGNLAEVDSMSNVEFDNKLTKRYGRIAGYYLGAKPVILVSDPSLIKIIQKESGTRKYFDTRPRRVPGGINPEPRRALMLGNLPVSEWQVMRKTIAQSFNGSSLRGMTADVKSKVDVFMEILSDTPPSTEIEFQERFQLLVLDIIGKIAFGFDSTMQTVQDDALHNAVKAEFSKKINGTLIKTYLCFPEFTPILSRLRCYVQRWKKEPESPLWTLAYKSLKERKRLGIQKSCTLMDHLISSSRGLTDDQIAANTVLMFEAAYDTTSSSLAFMVHLLAYHSRTQKKIRKEIRKSRRNHPANESEFLNSLKYLTACILECLRIYPPQTTFINRTSTEDLPYQNVTIPKGTHVQVGLIQLHQDPAVWPRPKSFQPNRFLEKEHPDTSADSKDTLGPRRNPEYDCMYQAFGQGSRTCVGKQLALIMLKSTLATILESYKIIPSARTEKKGQISIQYKTATMSPASGSYAKLVKLQ